MIKVMIADDEYLIREGMKNAIPWSDYGMEVVATAENGEEGVALARSCQPDLIITDICMPFSDGLEMSRTILEEAPATIVIVLTCYEEFDYAKQALKMGAFDYLLKPIDLDDFGEVLHRVKEKYQAQQQKRGGSPQLVSDLLHGRVDSAGFDHSLWWGCVLLRMLEFEYANSVLSSEELCCHMAEFQRMVDECGGAALLREDQLDEGRVLLVFSAREQEEIQRQITAVCRSLQSALRVDDDHPTLCAVSEIRQGEQNLPKLYGQCKEIIKTAYLCEDTRVTTYQEFCQQPDETSDISSAVEAFGNCMRTFDKRAVTEVLQEIYVGLQRGGHDSVLYGRLLVASLFVDMMKIAREVDADTEKRFGSMQKRYREVLAEDSFSSQIQKITEAAQEMCDYVCSKRRNPNTELICQAQKHIDENFTCSELTLQSTAQMVHISPSYLSVVFKQTLGKSFISYLTELRIERSKYLLQHTSQRVYEIGHAVGYDNPTYFSTLFKKYCGMGPTEYRAQFSEQPEV